ncbi:hypothetical protein Tco_1507905 [Tanacetum coccineum]
MYKERVRILEGINKDNNYLNEFLEADERAKRYNIQAQSQLVRDRDIIRDLEKQRNKLELDVKDHKRQKEEYQKTQMTLKQTQRDKEEKYLNDIFQLQAKIKDLENVVCKTGKSTDTLRLLTNEQKAFRDNLRKSGLGYNGPYVLSQAYAKIPKLYNAYELCNKSEQLHVFDSKEILEDAVKSQQKMTEKMNDPIAVANKQSCWTINYKKLNALYDDFVPQKELSVEQKYFPSSSIPSVKIPVSRNMPSESPLIKELDKIKVGFEKLSLLIQQNCKRASIFYTSPTEIEINDFCQDQVKPILNELKVYLEFFQNLFQRDIKEMKDVFESTESELNELEKQNELLKDQLLEASLAEDIKNLTYKNLFESVQRSKVETNQFDKVKVKDNFDEIETKNIELEYQVASLIKENEHLKLTYKNLFDSIKKSRVQTKTSNVTQNEAEKLKSQLFEFAETKTAKFKAYFEKLEKMKVVLERQLARKVDDSKAEKDQFLKEMNHLRTQLENLKGKFMETKFYKSSILGKPPADKLFVNSQISKSWFTPKADVQKDWSNPVTAQSLPKNEKDQLLKRIAYLESKLASQDIRSCQKEYHKLRTLYNALKVKFDSLNRKKGKPMFQNLQYLEKVFQQRHELSLEQSQHDDSNDILVDIEGVEE